MATEKWVGYFIGGAVCENGQKLGTEACMRWSSADDEFSCFK